VCVCDFLAEQRIDRVQVRAGGSYYLEIDRVIDWAENLQAHLKIAIETIATATPARTSTHSSCLP